MYTLILHTYFSVNRVKHPCKTCQKNLSIIWLLPSVMNTWHLGGQINFHPFPHVMLLHRMWHTGGKKTKKANSVAFFFKRCLENYQCFRKTCKICTHFLNWKLNNWILKTREVRKKDRKWHYHGTLGWNTVLTQSIVIMVRAVLKMNSLKTKASASALRPAVERVQEVLLNQTSTVELVRQPLQYDMNFEIWGDSFGYKCCDKLH